MRFAPLCSFILQSTLLVAVPRVSAAQEGEFLKEPEAPRAVFPDADRFERSEIPTNDKLKEAIRSGLGASGTSVWEPTYVIFSAGRGETRLGRAILVEEIGKHRAISFVVGVRSDGAIGDVAVMAYREAYGGGVASKRFLNQYRGKTADDSLQRDRGIINIAGATLSVDAASRAVRKALAIAKFLDRNPTGGEQYVH